MWVRSENGADCAYRVGQTSLLGAELTHHCLWLVHTSDTSDPVVLDGRKLPGGWYAYREADEPPGEHVVGNTIVGMLYRRDPELAFAGIDVFPMRRDSSRGRC